MLRLAFVDFMLRRLPPFAFSFAGSLKQRLSINSNYNGAYLKRVTWSLVLLFRFAAFSAFSAFSASFKALRFASPTAFASSSEGFL